VRNSGRNTTDVLPFQRHGAVVQCLKDLPALSSPDHCHICDMMDCISWNIQLMCCYCRVLKVGGQVVLLVGAEFRQLLLDCVSDLNNAGDSHVQMTSGNASSDNIELCDVNSDCVLGSDANETAADADGSTAADSNIMHAGCRQCDGAGKAENGPVWTSFIEHYVKLGETHAYICGFTKNR